MDQDAFEVGAQNTTTTLLVLFIPSNDRAEKPIDQDYWVNQELEVFGRQLGGATAYPKGRGVWRDDAQAGKLLFDETVTVHSYTTTDDLKKNAQQIREFFNRLRADKAP